MVYVLFSRLSDAIKGCVSRGFLQFSTKRFLVVFVVVVACCMWRPSARLSIKFCTDVNCWVADMFDTALVTVCHSERTAFVPVGWLFCETSCLLYLACVRPHRDINTTSQTACWWGWSNSPCLLRLILLQPCKIWWAIVADREREQDKWKAARFTSTEQSGLPCIVERRNERESVRKGEEAKSRYAVDRRSSESGCLQKSHQHCVFCNCDARDHGPKILVSTIGLPV